MNKTPRTTSRGLSALRSDSGLAVAGWLPWVGAIIVAGVIGGTLGLTGVLGHPTTLRTVYAADASLAKTAAGYSCPGGSQVTSLQGGDRVVAIARSADSDYLGVRNPLNLGETVWVHSGLVSVDSGEQPIATLPIQSCPTYSILMPPTNQGSGSGVAPTSPTKPTKPAPPHQADTTAPTLGTPSAGTPIVCIQISDPPHTDTITVTASDNVGVKGVSISWTGATTGSGAMTRSGSKWTYLYDAGSSTSAGTITFQLQARDAAGNLSAIHKVSITQAGCVH